VDTGGGVSRQEWSWTGYNMDVATRGIYWIERGYVLEVDTGSTGEGASGKFPSYQLRLHIVPSSSQLRNTFCNGFKRLLRY
jgi:hypothetical protein